jgi:ribosomal protein L24E
MLTSPSQNSLLASKERRNPRKNVCTDSSPVGKDSNSMRLGINSSTFVGGDQTPGLGKMSVAMTLLE